MTSIAAGKGDEFTTSYGVQELGKVLAWGSNENSEMGEGVIDSVTGQAIVSGGGLENIRVLEVAAGNGNAAALTENTTNNSYEYYVWGNNDNGQLGVDGKIVAYPTLVEALKDNPATPNADETILVSAVELSESHTIIIDALTKRAYTWGKNDHNQLGYQQSILNLSLIHI